ncbi:nuclear envelope protein [Cordyceps fumosorosea ARSEF 2679]|uniref:Nuclear envelope protein n=1 Tax=Cordyceps fumosorosea (strain ARSEF 2679) TaxID=1081104 RepID=A0A162MC08_CORFA|nr:nuclear envelope protein [Cordyceps fumosorosea ARSEF 2679]OAA54050.1 nuclear envelope protein [Cordyceps fumosorosea ARSEF 2679]
MVRRSHYKDTLQPALHRRFSSTAGLLLAVAYLEALTLASWSSLLWSWFPLGPTGIRTAVIFSCGLAILVLRIAHYHVGVHTESGVQSLKTSLTKWPTYETLFWYAISSAIFCPVYLWSLNDSAGLRWITYFSGDRARLNERPIFLACYLATCALVQMVVHFRYDADRLIIIKPVADKEDASTKTGGFLTGSAQKIAQQFPTVFAGCIRQATFSLGVAIVLYYALLRSCTWTWTLMMFRPFYNLPRTNLVPSSWPIDLFLMVRCVWTGALVNAIWAAGNSGFSIFMAKPPLKAGKPFTTESKDPNGSLLSGLNSKKSNIQCFAMWELAIIAQDFEAQRKAIFADIDRKDGPMWSQVYTICMTTLKSVEERVDAYGKPLLPTVPVKAPEEPRQRVSAPLKQDQIFTKSNATRSGVDKAWDQLARSPGSSPIAELSPLAKKTWRQTRDRMLTKEQQEAVSKESIQSYIDQATSYLLRLEWLGSIFRHEFSTEFAAAVLGQPYAEPTVYIHATQALCYLAVHSLAEDQFGNVHRDVPSIVRALTAIITKVEALKARFPIHWTDSTRRRESPEVDQVIDAMRVGLEQVVAKFEPYSADLRLNLTDLRLAKEAMTKKTPPPPQEEVVAAPGEDLAKEKSGAPVAKRVDLTRSRPITQRRAEPAVRQRLDQRRPEMEQAR